MSYKYKDIPNNKKVVWIRLMKEYEGEHKEYFPKLLNIGDKTWVYKEDYDKYFPIMIIENNRYMGNFSFEYFEDIYTEPNINILNLENYYKKKNEMERNYKRGTIFIFSIILIISITLLITLN